MNDDPRIISKINGDDDSIHLKLFGNGKGTIEIASGKTNFDQFASYSIITVIFKGLTIRQQKNLHEMLGDLIDKV